MTGRCYDRETYRLEKRPDAALVHLPPAPEKRVRSVLGTRASQTWRSTPAENCLTGARAECMEVQRSWLITRDSANNSETNRWISSPSWASLVSNSSNICTWICRRSYRAYNI